MKTKLPFYHLEKPPNPPSRYELLLPCSGESPDPSLARMIAGANHPHYVYWDKFKHKKPLFEDVFEANLAWALVHWFRNVLLQPTPIRTMENSYFQWLPLTHYAETHYKLPTWQEDIRAKLTPASAHKFTALQHQNLMDEAIASSQLEGAHTTRDAARVMLLNKKAARSPSDQMIINNFLAITRIEQEFKNEPLTHKLLFELHRLLTKETLSPDKQDRLRRDEDEIVVQGQIKQEIYTTNIPPNEVFLAQELPRLIAFANDAVPAGRQEDQEVLPPLVKAIFLHFWIGYLHPFVDGNGRLARTLFYWYLLRKGLWIFSYLPISVMIKNSPQQYAFSYLYTEQDNDDLTYFYDYQMRQIERAMREFEEHQVGKAKERQQLTTMIEDTSGLNERQVQLLEYFISSPSPKSTITSHATLHRITRQTAAKDLQHLQTRGLITSFRRGKNVVFVPAKKLLATPLGRV